MKEIIADLLTPVSAFLKIAEHSDYAFLFESVEGGERVARYSFLGKDPFLVLKARGGKTVIDRSGVTSESDEPFMDVLRRMMAEFQSPYVPGCHGSPAARSASSPTMPPRASSPSCSRRGPTPSGPRGGGRSKTTRGSCCSTRCWRSTT